MLLLKMNDTSACPVCVKIVSDHEKGLQCESTCERWFHKDCIPLSASAYKAYAEDSNKKWECNRVDCQSSSESSSVVSKKLDAILAQMSTLATKTELVALKDGIIELKNEFNSLNKKFNEIEPRLVSVEAEVETLKNKLDSSHDIETAMQEFNDRTQRSRNIIMHNLPESKSKDLQTRIRYDNTQVSTLLKTLCPALTEVQFKTFRIGQSVPNRSRPLKVVFRDVYDSSEFMKKFKTEALTDLDPTFADVNVTRDRTFREREYLNKLRAELERRTKAGEEDLTIKYVNGSPVILKKAAKNV